MKEYIIVLFSNGNDIKGERVIYLDNLIECLTDGVLDTVFIGITERDERNIGIGLAVKDLKDRGVCRIGHGFSHLGDTKGDNQDAKKNKHHEHHHTMTSSVLNNIKITTISL